VKESYYAVSALIDKVKALREKKGNFYVGSWAIFLIYPYDAPDFDYVVATVLRKEILSAKNGKVKFNEDRWNNIVNGVKEKMGESTLILSFIDNGGLEKYPMTAFSQKLTTKEQRRFLKEWDSYMRKKGIIPVYPVQDGIMGPNPQKMAYGKYNKYDSLAPEFETYEIIKELTQKK